MSIFGEESTVVEEPTQEAPSAPDGEQTEAASAEVPAADAAGDKSDPVLSAIEDLRADLNKSGSEEADATNSADVDLLAALEEEPDEAPAREAEPAPEVPAGEEDPQAKMQREFEQYVDQRARAQAQEMVTPILQQQRAKEVRELVKEYPDITSDEVLPELEKVINGMKDATGNDFSLDAPVVEMAYKLAKAQLADAKGAPAETVVSKGASLETNAGHSQTDASSSDQEYKKQVFGSGRTKSVFAGG